MKKVFLPLVAVVILFAAACSFGPKEMLIDSFEGDINNKTVDYGASNTSSLVVSADRELKVCGEQSLRLDYQLKTSGYMWAARGYNLDVKTAAKWEVEPNKIPWKNFNAISLQMYGQNTGSVVAFDIKDAAGEYWRFLLDDDFSGWKEITCPFDNFFARKDWQPEKATRNDILDFPIMSFQFEPRLPGKGVYRFDCVKAIKIQEKKKR
jgi:hypothetical protein